MENLCFENTRCTKHNNLQFIVIESVLTEFIIDIFKYGSTEISMIIPAFISYIYHSMFNCIMRTTEKKNKQISAGNLRLINFHNTIVIQIARTNRSSAFILWQCFCIIGYCDGLVFRKSGSTEQSRPNGTVSHCRYGYCFCAQVDAHTLANVYLLLSRYYTINYM